MSDTSAAQPLHPMPEPWPDGQQVEWLSDPRIGITVFTDHSGLYRRLASAVLALERDPRFAEWLFTGGGGTKVHNPTDWECPEAELLHRRAIAFFEVCSGSSPGVVDAAWANVYGAGDYCMPHSHLRAEASIVFIVEPGEPDLERDSQSGKLCFADPRLPYCAPDEEGRLTRLLVPDMPAGAMVIFPGALVHHVNPYNGNTPRISMSWNISSSGSSP